MRRAVVVATLMLAAACMREKADVSQNSPHEATVTSNPPTQAAPENDVQLLEYEIRMPDTLTAGVQRIRITNAGRERHGFAIEGMDIKANDIAAGDSSQVDINLKPGTYTVYCPMKGHRERGMQRLLTVP